MNAGNFKGLVGTVIVLGALLFGSEAYASSAACPTTDTYAECIRAAKAVAKDAISKITETGAAKRARIVQIKAQLAKELVKINAEKSQFRLAKLNEIKANKADQAERIANEKFSLASQLIDRTTFLANVASIKQEIKDAIDAIKELLKGGVVSPS